MSWRVGLGVAFIGMVVLTGRSSGGANEMVVLDAPRGAWLASVRSDAAIQILEERDGWKHIRLEGWVASSAAPAEGAAPATTAAAAPAGPAPSDVTASPGAARGGASIAGVLFALPGMQPSTPGGNLVVHLVGDPAALDEDLGKSGDACRATLRKDDEAIAALDDQVRQALNSTTNFTDATHRYDRAKSDLAAARKARAADAEACRTEVDTRLAAHAVARVLSDPGGRFEFRDVAAGRYRVVATEHSITAVRVWSIECTVGAGEPVVLDPRTAPPAPDPFAGLR